MVEGRIQELEQMIRRAELLGDGVQPTGKVVVGSPRRVGESRQ